MIADWYERFIVGEGVVTYYLTRTIPMVFGVLLMILAIYKAAEYWNMSSGFEGFELVKVLISDQIVYFVS